MKKIVALSLALVMLLSLAACGGSKEPAKTVVEKAITAVQQVDTEDMNAYWGSGKFEDIGEDADPKSVEIMSAVVANLSYNIVSSEEDVKAGTATVVVDITNIDMSILMGKYMQDAFSQLMQYALLPEDQRPSDDEMDAMANDIMMGYLESDDNETITTTITITLSLVDNVWVINTTPEAIDAMLGGMVSVGNDMDKAFNGAN